MLLRVRPPALMQCIIVHLDVKLSHMAATGLSQMRTLSPIGCHSKRLIRKIRRRERCDGSTQTGPSFAGLSMLSTTRMTMSKCSSSRKSFTTMILVETTSLGLITICCLTQRRKNLLQCMQSPYLPSFPSSSLLSASTSASKSCCRIIALRGIPISRFST